MKIEMDPILFEKVSNLKLAINHYTKTIVSESPQMIKGRLQLFQEYLYFDLEDKPLADFPGIKEWRYVFDAFGTDSNLHYHSLEALMREIANLNYLEPLHSAVDLNSFFSLQYEMPIGIYDADKISGDISLSIGSKDTGYEDLNENYLALDKVLALSDDNGAFGSPSIDSTRTAVTEETTNILQVFFLRPSIDADEALELATAAGNMFTSVNGGDFHSYVIDKNKFSIDIK